MQINDNRILYVEDFAAILRGRSGHVKTFCPFCHDQRNDKRDKSLSIDTQSLGYKCHYCDASGYLKSRLQETLVSINHTPKMKKEYKLPSKKPNIQSNFPKEFLEFFTNRGISEQTLLDAKVTKETEFMPQDNAKRGVIAFNYYLNGELINVKYRTRDKHFKLVSGAQLIPYNIDSISDEAYHESEEKTCIITEGEMDALTYMECGYRHVISVPSGANSNLEWLDDFIESHFDKMNVIYVSTDGDRKGLEAQKELVRRFGADMCKVVEYPKPCKDINEVLMQYGKEKVMECINIAGDVKINGIKEVFDVESSLDDLFTNGLEKGVTIQMPHIDNLLSFITGMLCVITGVPSHGKALSLDTPLPSPNGWIKMGDVNVGDELYDDEGKICRVTYVTPVQHNRNCYRMIFNDKSEIICDEEHLWVTRDDRARRSAYRYRKRVERKGTTQLLPRGTDQSFKRTFPQERTTKEIMETLYTPNEHRTNHAIKVQGALQGIECELPLNPYVLGVWLSEGVTIQGAVATGDIEIIERIRLLGFEVTKRKDKYSYGIIGLSTILKQIGILGNKRIPSIYLRAKYEDRLELMKGMMDGDGTCLKDGTCSYSSSIKELADDFYELVMSMGLKASMTSKIPTLNGVPKKRSYCVNFRPNFHCFTLERKNARIHDRYGDEVNWRFIKSVEKVDSVPVRCIQVDSPNHMYLCGKSMIPTHNTYWLNFMLARLNILHNWKVAFFSPEFYPVTLHISQIIETLGGRRFDHTNYNDDVYEKLKEYTAKNFFWIDPDDTDINSVLERAKYLIRKKGIKAFVIDPFNSLTDSERKVQKQDEYISDFLQKTRWFARKYNVAIFIVMHPTKQQRLENGLYPVCDLYDCKGASEIFDKADIGITVWRNENGGYGEVHVTKIKFRHLGNKGKATFKFNFNNGRYVEIEDADKNHNIHILDSDVQWDNSNYVIEKMKAEQVQQSITFDGGTTTSDYPFEQSQETAPF